MVALANLYFAGKTISRPEPTGKYFGITCILAALVSFSYVISILLQEKILVSLFSSIYFAAIDWMLVFLLSYVVLNTRGQIAGWEKKMIWICGGIAVAETLIFAVNPFWEIAMHYLPTGREVVCYRFDPMLLYRGHLLFTYYIVVAVLFLLIRKSLLVPDAYRIPYVMVVTVIILVVSVNAVFLFLPGDGVVNILDWSIWGYSIGIFFMYWGEFLYRKRGLLNRLKKDVFESLDQGLMLFDNSDKLVLHNRRAEEMITGLDFQNTVALDTFTGICGIGENAMLPEDRFSMQCFPGSNGINRPLRCDNRMLVDRRGKKLGRLFVFTDVSMETDVLTGFQTWEGFCHFVKEHPESGFRETVVAFDINGLAAVNQLQGTEAGDRMIQQLSLIIRKHFPQKTYYVREMDANLVAVVYGDAAKDLQDDLDAIRREFEWDFQYGIQSRDPGNGTIIDTIQEAIRGMRNKKLLDRNSARSESLASLMRAMKESDGNSEKRNARMQKLCRELGLRLGISDVQLSDLSLLCLLYDIGKIGVPLDILNKQGNLTNEEWTLLRSHAEKGYQIAKSSRDLTGIADCIRYHHERWDGRGYPAGLSRESIPLLSRVIAVVDAYDAMTSDRPYRKRMPEAEARQEILNGAGGQFDPHIVSEFLQMLEESTPDTAESTAVSNNRDKTWSAEDRRKTTGTGSVHEVRFSRYLLNADMMVIWADENFVDLTGYSQEDVATGLLSQADLIPEEDRSEYFVGVEKQLAAKQMAYFEHRLRKKGGKTIFVFCYGRFYFDSAVNGMRSEIIITDLTHTYSFQAMADKQQNKAQRQLEQWENTYRRDSMTGLLNHSAFQNDVEYRLLQNEYQVIMLMLDVDHFKEYNDQYGHHAGDEFLVLLAQTLQGSLRDGDLCSRMGGDEFSAALFFGMNAEETVILSRIRQIYDNLMLTVKSQNPDLGVSMGAAISNETTNTFRQLYVRADQALYQSKENGRGRLTIAEK